jgi:hypothetical protein
MERTCASDPGVVDQNVDPPLSILDSIHRSLHAFIAEDVQRELLHIMDAIELADIPGGSIDLAATSGELFGPTKGLLVGDILTIDLSYRPWPMPPLLHPVINTT